PQFSRARSCGCGGTKRGPGIRPGPPSMVRRGSAQGAAELADLLVGALAVPPVALLELAGQVLGIALGNVEHVVGQVTPARLRLAFYLAPLAGDDVGIHWRLLVGERGSSLPRQV